MKQTLTACETNTTHDAMEPVDNAIIAKDILRKALTPHHAFSLSWREKVALLWWLEGRSVPEMSRGMGNSQQNGNMALSSAITKLRKIAGVANTDPLERTPSRRAPKPERTEKRCPDCGDTKGANDFYIDADRRWSTRCRPCTLAHNSARQAERRVME